MAIEKYFPKKVIKATATGLAAVVGAGIIMSCSTCPRKYYFPEGKASSYNILQNNDHDNNDGPSPSPSPAPGEGVSGGRSPSPGGR